MNRRNFERIYPYIVSLILIGVFMYSNINKITLSRFDILISSIISISATIIGFIITIIAILIGLLDERIMKIIKKNDGMKLLREYLIVPVLLGFILIVLSNILIFIVKEDCVLSGFNFYLATFILVSFMLSLIRIGCILYRIFGQVTEVSAVEEKKTIKLGEEEYF